MMMFIVNSICGFIIIIFDNTINNINVIIVSILIIIAIVVILTLFTE